MVPLTPPGTGTTACLNVPNIRQPMRRPFPGTGAWDSYASISLERPLVAGEHTVALEYDAAAGSSNFLNLDHLLVKPAVPFFIRADLNRDLVLDVSDAVAIVLFLFHGEQGGASCAAAADADGNGTANITDAIHLLRDLFLEGSPPTAPFPECGPEPAGASLGCDGFPPCE